MNPAGRSQSHPLLQQTPLSVNPFIDLPKPPTLPHNYASLPSTLPASCINASPGDTNPPAYVTSSSGFAAHPSTIIAQNRALLAQLETQHTEARAKVEQWQGGIRDRELAEKRRKAPGWLDSDNRLLEPNKAGSLKTDGMAGATLLDELDCGATVEASNGRKAQDVDALGEAMDRAFGKGISEMG